MTTITLPRSGGLSEAGLSSTLALARALYAAIARSYRIRQDRRALQSMPDHLLSDIGISRSKIEAATEFGRSRGGTW